MESKLAAGVDDRFYTPRSSGRRGYSSASSEDERFVSSRESARSVSSDDNEYGTPRESVLTPTEQRSAPVSTASSAKYLDDALRGNKRFPTVAEMKQALPEHSDDGGKYDHKLQQNGSAKENYLGLATGGTISARTSEVRGVQYADAPAVPENDIFSAARHNRVDSVTYMLDQGVAVNSKDEFGNTILSIACQNGLKRMAKLALRRGANINSQNLRGNTALHFCFTYGYGDTLGAYLISKGADTTIENKDGSDCYHVSTTPSKHQALGIMGCDRLILGSGDAHSMAEEEDDAERMEQRRVRYDSGGGGSEDDEQKHEGVVSPQSSWRRAERADPLAARLQGVYAHARNIAIAPSAPSDDFSDDTDIEEEMMRIDPGDVEWRRQLHVGDPVDAQNVFGNWCPATILRMADGEAQIRYLNMNDAWHRWIPSDSGQLAQPATKTRNDSSPVRLAQQIEVRRTIHGMWKEAHVVRSRPSDILVRYAGRQQQFDEWIPFTPDTVAPLGEHIQHRNFALQRQLSVTPKSTRNRVFQAQNPRYQHYRNALEAQGLRIYPIEGDGNCLFRSVSHQIYGDDRHHAVVRATCMDYMEGEKEYFEPYVVGDMAAFLRYLNYKRRPGVWGDDPELQAMCELYDRPAEVYAYDAADGFRKLRTFHESSGVSRNRPPIRLSYYGGGHYDSLVGLNHSVNCIRDPPGEWEHRHIEYSRRINTRVRDGDGITATSEEGVVRQVAAESDRETTEMAQLEQTLLLSRNEFDGMNSSLDDTLKLSLQEYESSGAVAASSSPSTGPASAAAGASDQELDAATRESEMAAIQADLIAKAKQVSEEDLVKQAIEASLETLPHGTHDLDFDEQVSAAIQASLGHFGSSIDGAATNMTTGSGGSANDYDEQMRLALELSTQEYHGEQVTAGQGANDLSFNLMIPESDEDDELQRAIQASLQQP